MKRLVSALQLHYPKQHTSILLVAVAIIGVFLVSLLVATTVLAQSEVDASKRLITVHDRGKNRGILTSATTLREAFSEAGVAIDARDLVEPGLDEPLDAESYDVNIYRARPVLIIDGAATYRIITAYQTATQIAQAADVNLHPEDETAMTASSDPLVSGAGLVLEIDRAVAITFDMFGKKLTLRTQSTTVAELLDEHDIVFTEQDRVSPAVDTTITEDMSVAVWREGRQTRTVEEAVKYGTEIIEDADKPATYRQVRTEGVNGVRNVTYEMVIKNGKVVKKIEVASVTTKQPVKEVVVVGAKSPFGDDLAAAFAALRQCESGGNYANKNNPRYRGAYQFSYETWANNGGYYDPADAPPALQDAAALALYERRGWQPWPACSAALGLR